MPVSDVNLAERSGSLVEEYKGYDPRVVLFYFLIAAMLLTLAGGLAYQQLLKTTLHSERERLQNQRRIIVPGPRGNIYDRNGRTLVTNQPVFSAVLYVDELRAQLRAEQIRIHNNYLAVDRSDMPLRTDLEQIARLSVAQSYLDRVIRLLGRDPASPEAKINAEQLKRHFRSAVVLPFPLIDHLTEAECARLLEALPVNSPLQVYVSSSRHYPYGATAAHVLGAVRVNDENAPDDFPGEDLHTFALKHEIGTSGLEKQYDDTLQGVAGGSIFRVDPSGFRINPPLDTRAPRQGHNLTTTLDLDLQQAAETALGDQTGAAVALDVSTGEVLVMASKPDFDLNLLSPHATQEFVDQLNATGAWENLALRGLYPPGSTFKPLVAIAGMRSGQLDPEDTSANCDGYLQIGNRPYGCENGTAHHGHLRLSEALAVSCDIYFWSHGLTTGIEAIAAEAHRFHLDQPTGIDLPSETRKMIVPDPAFKKRRGDGGWTDGDTANTSIGQGYLWLTPLQMACFAASLARNETVTHPKLVHDPAHTPQHSEPIGLSAEQRQALVNGMIACTEPGAGHTAGDTFTKAAYQIPGVTIAGKTGTAQVPGRKNVAWFICFAPADHPEIAVAVAVEGEESGETYAGGMYAAPVAATILKTYFTKQSQPAAPVPELWHATAAAR